MSKNNPKKWLWESQGVFLYFPCQPSWELLCLSSSFLASSLVPVAQRFFGGLALRAVQGKSWDVERCRSCSWFSYGAARQGCAALGASVCSCWGRQDMELLPALTPEDNELTQRPAVLVRHPTVTQRKWVLLRGPKETSCKTELCLGWQTVSFSQGGILPAALGWYSAFRWWKMVFVLAWSLQIICYSEGILRFSVAHQVHGLWICVCTPTPSHTRKVCTWKCTPKIELK